MKPSHFRLSKLKLFYLIFLPASVLAFIYIKQDTQHQLDKLTQKKEDVLALKQELEMERDYLKHNIELLSNADYFKSYAKRKLLYTSEGELLFIFPDEEKDALN